MKEKAIHCLKKAEKYFFSTGLNDVSAQLSRANTIMGLAKIHSVQEQLGFSPNATFVSAPDLCISRNIEGWSAGFGYGGKLVWGDGNQELIILDVHPNACGTLLGGLENRPNPQKLLRRVEEIKEENKPEIDGITIEWDLGRRNHFLRVDKVISSDSNLLLPNYTFIIHCSARELKQDTQVGVGLYHEQSEILQERLETFNTPFGPLNVLTGKFARDFAKQHEFAREFALKRRKLLAERLFGEFTEISNRIHQGLLDMNQMLLGAQPIIPGTFNDLYPIMLRGDLPITLLKATKWLTDKNIDRLGFRDRARELGVEHRLKSAQVLPHGGGYHFPQIKKFKEVIQTETGHTYFSVEYKSGNQLLIPDALWLEFKYRGEEVLDRIEEIGDVKQVAKLNDGYTLKI